MIGKTAAPGPRRREADFGDVGVTPPSARRHHTGISREEIYRTYATELTKYATGLVGPSHAPDVVADAVLRVMWSKGWESVRNHRAYLYQAVLNEAKMHHRATSRRLRRERQVAVPDRAPTMEPRPDVRAAVQRLSIRQRAAVFLTYWEGLPPRAVAERMGVTEGAVRRHLARARLRLKDLIDE